MEQEGMNKMTTFEELRQHMINAEAIIGVSAVSGSQVTVRAIGTRPTVDVYATIMWSGSNIS